MQSTKKWLIITVAIAFGITVIASCIMLFSVKKVATEFSVYGDSDAVEIQKDLETFKGKSLIFLNAADVYKIAEKYPHYEITSVEKEYPNVLKVSVIKRTEVFKVVTAEKSYVLDGNGYIINDTGVTEYKRNVVPINMDDISVTDGTVGKKIITSDDGLFYSVIKTAQSLNLNDSVKNISIEIGVSGKRDAIFTTYTGVDVEVWKVEENGEEKIQKAFALYDSEKLGDYEKSAGKILSLKSKTDGEIVAEWTSH